MNIISMYKHTVEKPYVYKPYTSTEDEITELLESIDHINNNTTRITIGRYTIDWSGWYGLSISRTVTHQGNKYISGNKDITHIIRIRWDKIAPLVKIKSLITSARNSITIQKLNNADRSKIFTNGKLEKITMTINHNEVNG